MDGGAPDSGSADSSVADDGAVDASEDVGPSDSSAVDSSAIDSGAVDSGAVDSGAVDSGAATDSGVDAAMDSAVAMDAGGDAATGCHGHDFGAPQVSIVGAAGSAPAATGGSISSGSYDLVGAQNYGGSATGVMRSTWVIEDATTLQELTAINLSGSGALPTATPRTRRWETSAARLLTTRTCEGSDTLANDYSVETGAGGTTLVVHVDLGSGSRLLLSYRRR